MPAKVIEPDGNQMNVPTGSFQCGYLVRADVTLDSQGELKRILFVNDNQKKLKKGDLVMIDNIQPYNATITTTDGSGNTISGSIMVVKIPPVHFDKNWPTHYKQKWDEKWDENNVPQDRLNKLKLKQNVGRPEILGCNGKSDVDGISLLP